MFRIRQVLSLLKVSILTGIVGLTLSACQTTSLGGQGDIILSKEAASAYVRDYMPRTNPLAFAVSTGGQYWYYWSCGGAKCSNENSLIRKTLEQCEAKGNVPCRLFAHRKEIVWKKSDGRLFTVDDVYDVLGISEYDRVKEHYANIGSIPLCRSALEDAKSGWSEKYTNRHYVEEAKNRGMSVEFCRKLSGQTR